MACVQINPVVVFDDSCPTIIPGTVDKMFLTRATTVDYLQVSFTLAQLDARIDNAAVDGNPVGAAPIREFSVIGSTSDREVTDVVIPLGDVYSVRGNKVWSGRIVDLTTENLAWAVQVSEAGSIKKKAWFQTGSLFVGGYKGIDGFLRVDLVVGEDRATPIAINWTFTHRASLFAIATTLLPVYP